MEWDGKEWVTETMILMTSGETGEIEMEFSPLTATMP